MLINLRGHVESDPMAIPAPARMDIGVDDSFEQMLRQSVAERTEPREEPRDERADDEVKPAPADAAPPAEPPVDDAPPTAPAPETLEVTHTMHLEAAPADDDIRAAGSERQNTAGKGTDSPRSSPAAAGAPSAEPLLAAFLQQGAARQPAPIAGSAATGGVGAIGATRAAGELPARGLAGAAQRGTTPLPAPAVASSYRTTGAASAQLLDQARDSVFKQILLQLQPEGGEMRVRLQPPELGELDLRLVVEDGNKLSLTMAAERADLTDLLQRHLDELKQSLQQAGLDVTSANVQTRGEFARGQQREPQRHDDGAFASQQERESTSRPRFGGQLRANGLDFWA